MLREWVPQRPAKLGTGLRDPGGGAGPPGRRRADNQVIRQGEQGRETEREGDGRGYQERESRTSVEPRQGSEAQGREQEAAGDHGRWTDVTDQARHHYRANYEGECPGQRPETRLERRESEHELKVLRTEEEAAEQDEHAETVQREGRAEGRDSEESQINQRV